MNLVTPLVRAKEIKTRNWETERERDIKKEIERQCSERKTEKRDSDKVKERDRCVFLRPIFCCCQTVKSDLFMQKPKIFGNTL